MEKVDCCVGSKKKRGRPKKVKIVEKKTKKRQREEVRERDRDEERDEDSTDVDADPDEFESSKKKVNAKNSDESNLVGNEPIIERSPFVSCLNTFNQVTSSNGANLTALLRRAMSIQELEDTSWLSSTLIDLVMSQFAKQYPNVDYLSMDFLLFMAANSKQKSQFDGFTDILGRLLQYQLHRPIIFLWNKGNIHWTLIRATFHPTPELQFFEPMGKLPSRGGHLSYRYVPRDVVHWLDTCSPLPNGRSWLTVSSTAITNQQQFTSFDCGVACLLYAEKCGLGFSKEEINHHTTQEDITSYRKNLQDFMKQMGLVNE